ncbi:Gfo/Idh/MocA family protein [Bacteroidota bacterium]
MENPENQSRRRFIESSAVIGALGTLGISQMLSSCKSDPKLVKTDLKSFLNKAPDGQALKAGVIGCGGRGTGATFNFLDAGNDLTIHAIADVFQDRVDNIRKKLKDEKDIDIDEGNVFIGFDAYKRLLETDVDVVILATPPYFRPIQFQAAIEARKHVFMEKPVAVDPGGARLVMAASKQAEAAGLCVVTGTQRRHARDYNDIYSYVKGGSMGDLVASNVYWNQSKLWHKDNQPGWTEMEYMIRDWVNWTWLSGDHIVEQHIHQLDVAHWFFGKVPVSATGVGSRQRRLTGDCYDNFSVDFVYDDEVHMHSMCRQINDCSNNVSQMIRGTNGYTNCNNAIWNPDGSTMYEFTYPIDENGESSSSSMLSPMVQEHIDLVEAIRTGNQVVLAEETAKSTLVAIMGREAAYTGKTITWEEMMGSDLKLGPETIALGPVDMEYMVPKPGSSTVE